VNDLFGNLVDERMLPCGELTKQEKRRRKEICKGYVMPPGTGPAGETCRTCYHACKVNGGSKDYWKCGLNRHKWSGCAASDIRLKSPACRKWESKTED